MACIFSNMWLYQGTMVLESIFWYRCARSMQEIQRRSYADAYGIPSTYVYTMMSWLREEPMAEHVAVEFWNGYGRPLKCLRTLPL